MGIFDEIAAAIGGDTAIEIPSNCRQANITTKLGPTTTEKDFIEWSADNPQKKTDPDNPGNKPKEDNYYTNGLSGAQPDTAGAVDRREEFNREWATTDLINLGSECFTYLFRRKLW